MERGDSMYRHVEIKNGELLARRDSSIVLQQFPLDKLSFEKILLQNKIEYYEGELNRQQARKQECEKKIVNNYHTTVLLKLIMYAIIGVLFACGIIFMPLTPLVTNLGLISFVGLMVTSAMVGRKGEKNEDVLTRELKKAEERIEMLKEKLGDFSNQQNFLNIAPRHVRLNVKNVDECNKRLKDELLKYREEIISLHKKGNESIEHEVGFPKEKKIKGNRK